MLAPPKGGERPAGADPATGLAKLAAGRGIASRCRSLLSREPPLRDLLFCAKHLFVAAIGDSSTRHWRDGHRGGLPRDAVLGGLSPIEAADDSRYARLLECADRLSHPGTRAAGHPKSGVGWQPKPRHAPRPRPLLPRGVGGHPAGRAGLHHRLAAGLREVHRSVDQRTGLECGVGFRQLRTCRRTTERWSGRCSSFPSISRPACPPKFDRMPG